MSSQMRFRLAALTLALAVAPLCNAAAKTSSAKASPAKTAPATHRLSYGIEPAPAWVVPAQERAGVTVDAAPMHYRVIDEQLRVDGATQTEYAHVVRVVDSSAGLSTASQIELEFDPSYQTLVMHHLEVVRDGKRLNRLTKTFPMLQRETQLERQMYDGRATLSIVVDDVRVGDQIDFAYSIRGANPVFDGKFVHGTFLGSERGPAALYQVRLLAPAERDIHYQATGKDVKVESTVNGTWRDTRFRHESARQLQLEPHAPMSATLPEQLALSEFADWSDVARWGRRMFDAAAPGRGLDAKAAEIQAAAPKDRAAQVLAALQFVQKDVRYFGTEIGENTHRPTTPDKVIEQRFGDCKDKVLLLTALLHRLGVPSTPVLVSTSYRNALRQMLPTPLAFDHVIARVDLDGQSYWLDATRSEQTGPLAKRQSVELGVGLPLAGATAQLAALPAPYDVDAVAVKDTVHFDRLADDPVLESRVTYRGEVAEAMRAGLASRGIEPIAAELGSPYLKIYPKARSTGPVTYSDAADDNAITFVQHFTVPGFWRFPDERMLVADLVTWTPIDALSYPKSETRRDAFSLGLPGVYRHTVSVEFPEDVFKQPSTQHAEDNDAHFKLTVSSNSTRRRTELTAELHITADEVTPAQWKGYTAKLAKVSNRLATVIAVSPVPQDRLDAIAQSLKSGELIKKARDAKLVTETQRDAFVRAMTLSAEIDGGRLSPALLAQALTARGVEYDNMGRIDDAQADFTHALALAPDTVDTLNGAAVNAFDHREFDKAVSLADQVLKQDASNVEALHTRAIAHYFRDDLGAARSDLQSMLKDDPRVRRGYPLLWLWLAERRAGTASDVQAVVSTEQLPTEWPRPLIDLAFGKNDVNAVINAAKATKNAAESLCEAYFYIGERYFAEGDTTHAREYWRKAVDQGIVEYVEDNAARLRLASVGTR